MIIEKTAKAESKRGKDWNDLDQEQKDRLIKYFGRKKARWEASLEAKLTDEEERGKLWEKELYQMIEVVKHHEERGKKDCSCWSCKVHKEVQQEIKAKEKKKLKEWGEKQDRQRGLKDEGAEEWTQSECANCYEYKKVSVESGLCRKCEKEADEGYGED